MGQIMRLPTILLALVAAAFITVAPTAGAADEAVASGTFKGASGHKTSGGVSIKKSGKGYVAVLEDDFSLDGAPDPKLGFGKNGYDTSTTFSELRSNSGRQEYQIPADIDPAKFNEFYVWCEKFSVPLGVAKLK